MRVTLGHAIGQEQANEWMRQLARRLPDEERVVALAGAHPHMGHDLHVVTTERVLMVATRPDYAVKDQFRLDNVRTAYTADDNGEQIVHIPLRDDGHWIMRPAVNPHDAGMLAMIIYSGAVQTNPQRAPDPLVPEDDGSTEPSMFEQAGFDYLALVVPHEEILAGDVQPMLRILTPLIRSRRTARQFMERVSIAFDGYSDTTAELFEIKEVRAYVRQLDSQFPYWLYFLDKRTNSFDAMWRCFMPPDLTEAAALREYPKRLEPLLRNWWTPALDAVCEFAGVSEQEHYALCDRYSRYFQGERDF